MTFPTDRNRLSLPGLLKTYRHPEYQTRESRIASFINWPSELTQTPEQLADAGLYYTGKNVSHCNIARFGET